MKILLCTLPKHGVNVPPLALAYLQAACRSANIDTAVKDLNLDLWRGTIHTDWWEIWKESNTDLYKGQKFYQFLDEVYRPYLLRWADEIAAHDAPFVGLSCFSYRSLPTLKLLSPLIRAKAPHKQLIVGGAPIATYADWIIKENLADWAVKSEGDIALPRIIKGDIPRGVVETTQIADLNSLSIADYTGLDFNDYVPGDPGGLRIHHGGKADRTEAGLIGSRGCVRRCTFCDVETYWPAFRWREPAHIFKEMMMLRDNGVEHIYFYDSLINGNQKQLEALLDLIIAAGSPFKSIKGLAIIKRQPERIYAKMAKARVSQLSIGIESFSEEMRRQMRKRFSNDMVADNLDMYRRYGIKIVLLLVVGYPSETEQHHREQLDWLRDNIGFAGNPVTRVEIGGTMIILPGAPVMKEKMFNLYVDKDNEWVTKNSGEFNTMAVRVRRRREIESAAAIYGFNTGSAYGEGGQLVGDHEKDNVADYRRPQDDLILLEDVDALNFEEDGIKDVIGWDSDPSRVLHANS